MKLLALCIYFFATHTSYALTVDNESQLSVIQTGGNAVTETFNAKTESIFKTESKWEYTLSGHYTLASAEIVDENGDTVMQENAKNWSLLLKPEKNLSDKLSIFLQAQYEGNEFAGFSQRDNYDIGGKYKLINEKKRKLSIEAGFRYTVERRSDPAADVEGVIDDEKGRLFSEYKVVNSENLRYKFWVEYIPNFTNNTDYLINFEPSATVTLSDNFSLKLAYLGQYDNQPAVKENEYLDFTYTTSILIKY